MIVKQREYFGQIKSTKSMLLYRSQYVLAASEHIIGHFFFTYFFDIGVAILRAAGRWHCTLSFLYSKFQILQAGLCN